MFNQLSPDGPGRYGGDGGEGGAPVPRQAGGHAQCPEEPHPLTSHTSLSRLSSAHTSSSSETLNIE